MTIEDAQRVFGYEHDTTNIQQGTDCLRWFNISNL